jgi:hypothetical protein
MMNQIEVEWHMFGSDGGYRTVAATSGITPGEIEELEKFNFSVDTLGLEATRFFATSGSAFLMPLRSGRLAIRRILADAMSDNYGRRALVAVSLVVSNEQYLQIAGTDDGRDGLGLEGLIHRLSFWRDLSSERGTNASPVLISVAPAGSWVRRLFPEDFEIFDRWQFSEYNASKNGTSNAGVAVPRESPYESRVLALPALLSPRMALQYRWGFRVMRSSVPGLVASYLEEGLAPYGSHSLPDEQSGMFRSARTRQGHDELMFRFPEEKWHPHQKYAALELKLKEALQGAAAAEAKRREQSAVLNETIRVKDSKNSDLDRQKRALSDECITLSDKIEALGVESSALRRQRLVLIAALIFVGVTAIASWYRMQLWNWWQSAPVQAKPETGTPDVASTPHSAIDVPQTGATAQPRDRAAMGDRTRSVP